MPRAAKSRALEIRWGSVSPEPGHGLRFTAGETGREPGQGYQTRAAVAREHEPPWWPVSKHALRHCVGHALICPMYDDVVAVASKTNATLCDEFLLSSSVELFRQPKVELLIAPKEW
jgi:hypothetical protein